MGGPTTLCIKGPVFSRLNCDESFSEASHFSICHEIHPHQAPIFSCFFFCFCNNRPIITQHRLPFKNAPFEVTKGALHRECQLQFKGPVTFQSWSRQQNEVVLGGIFSSVFISGGKNSFSLCPSKENFANFGKCVTVDFDFTLLEKQSFLRIVARSTLGFGLEMTKHLCLLVSG